jgi:hypothetical protein
MRHTKWIYVSSNYTYSITTWTEEKISKVFNLVTQKYESNHVITCVEVEHGRNHLIIGH